MTLLKISAIICRPIVSASQTKGLVVALFPLKMVACTAVEEAQSFGDIASFSVCDWGAVI